MNARPAGRGGDPDPRRAPAEGGGWDITSAVVIGTGLIGTSIALALRARGATVWLADRDEASARLAADIGAGAFLPLPAVTGSRDETTGGRRPGPARAHRPAPKADLAVLAVPPAAVAPALAAAQSARLARWYTDVASVKGLPVAGARDLGCDLASFVPGHPLSGRERSGPAAARADLFLGRPWVLCPGPGTAPAAVAAALSLVRQCQAEPVRLGVAEHDRWVALVSHAPHVVSAAMAARLADAPAEALGLAGQGLRDVTRIAGGDAGLWAQILAANAGPVADVLGAVAADLAAVAAELARVSAPAGAVAPAGPGAAGHGSATGRGLRELSRAASGDDTLKVLTALLDRGIDGAGGIPGKRGSSARTETVVQVVIPDRPGELARLFQAAGAAGVNIEDVTIEHSPGLPVGVAELTVGPGAAGVLTEALAAAGWPVRR